MTTLREMAGPVELEEDDIGRPWPERWSISGRGLEVILHVLRRHKPDECRRLAKQVSRAFEIAKPH